VPGRGVLRGFQPARDSPTCYKCYERCPQGTHPIEVVTALKNIAFEKGNAPEEVTALRETVKENGTIIVRSEAIEKRRDELGLARAAAAPAADIKKLLE
jgi:heterodisulfide reductase subunit C